MKAESPRNVRSDTDRQHVTSHSTPRNKSDSEQKCRIEPCRQNTYVKAGAAPLHILRGYEDYQQSACGWIYLES